MCKSSKGTFNENAGDCQPKYRIKKNDCETKIFGGQ